MQKFSKNQKVGNNYLFEILFTFSVILHFFLHVAGLKVISSLSIPLYERSTYNKLNQYTYCNLLTVRQNRQGQCKKGLQGILKIHIIYV